VAEETEPHQQQPLVFLVLQILAVVVVVALVLAMSQHHKAALAAPAS
jgi:hypothetical protein